MSKDTARRSFTCRGCNFNSVLLALVNPCSAANAVPIHPTNIPDILLVLYLRRVNGIEVTVCCLFDGE